MEKLPPEIFPIICQHFKPIPSSLESFAATSKAFRLACSEILERSRKLDQDYGHLDLVVYRSNPRALDVCEFIRRLVLEPSLRYHVRTLRLRNGETGVSTDLYNSFEVQRTEDLVEIGALAQLVVMLAEATSKKIARRVVEDMPTTWILGPPGQTTMLALLPIFPYLQSVSPGSAPLRLQELAGRIAQAKSASYTTALEIGGSGVHADVPLPFAQLRHITLTKASDRRCLKALGDILCTLKGIDRITLDDLTVITGKRAWLRDHKTRLRAIHLTNTRGSIELLETLFKGLSGLQQFAYQLQDFDDNHSDWTYWAVAVEVLREKYADSLESLSLTCVDSNSAATLTMRSLPTFRLFKQLKVLHLQAALLIHDGAQHLADSNKSLHFQSFRAYKDPTIKTTKLCDILPHSIERLQLDIGRYMEVSCRIFSGLDGKEESFSKLDEVELQWHGEMELDRRIAKVLEKAAIKWERVETFKGWSSTG